MHLRDLDETIVIVLGSAYAYGGILQWRTI